MFQSLPVNISSLKLSLSTTAVPGMPIDISYGQEMF